MKPAAILLLTLALGLATSATPGLAQATPPSKRTILVGGAATPRANGTNLLAALATTGATGPSNRWLLRLEPGVYNLASSQLVVKDFVDIEGSGRGLTTITSKAAATVFWPPEVTAEVRDLTVQNFSTSGFSDGVSVQSSNARLSRVNVLARGATSATAVRIHQPGVVISPVLTDVQLSASAGSANHFATGLFIVGANPVVRNLSVTITRSPNVDAIFVGFGAAPLLEEVEVAVGGDCQSCTGLNVFLGSSLKLTRSRIVVTGQNSSAVEHVRGGTVEISHSFLSATGSSTTGIGIQEVDGGILVVEHSSVEGHAGGQGHSIYSAGATVRVAMSRLVGPILNGLSPGSPGSTFTCLGAYDESFTPLSTDCE